MAIQDYYHLAFDPVDRCSEWLLKTSVNDLKKTSMIWFLQLSCMYSHVKQKKRKTKHSKPPSYKTAALPKSKYVQCLVNQRKFLRWNRKSPHSFSNILHCSGCEDLALHKLKKNTTHFTLKLINTFQFESVLFQTKNGWKTLMPLKNFLF